MNIFRLFRGPATASFSRRSIVRARRYGVLALFACLFAVGGAQAACPDGSPCETVKVYRVQTWPGLRSDANGVDLLSLREANASSKDAFGAVIKGYAGGSDKILALRFIAKRIADAPNGYCNCNFERASKACKAPITPGELRQCVRACYNSGAVCAYAGVDDKKVGGGAWYAFPKATEWSAGKAWKKNAFGPIKAGNGDWTAQAAVIKRAKCIGDQVQAHPGIDIDTLFDAEVPCATVDNATLAREEIAR